MDSRFRGAQQKRDVELVPSWFALPVAIVVVFGRQSTKELFAPSCCGADDSPTQQCCFQVLVFRFGCPLVALECQTRGNLEKLGRCRPDLAWGWFQVDGPPLRLPQLERPCSLVPSEAPTRGSEIDNPLCGIRLMQRRYVL